MCGIFGTLNYNTLKNLKETFKELIHKWIDKNGHVNIDNLELYDTSLAIQDLTSTGKQFMHHNGLYIILNGEIYNHLELRKKYGLTSKSHSYTKSILMLYETLGMIMLNEFDGLFAFALYDSNKNELFLVRDRTGKKPLYIYIKDNKCIFSSELNTLIKIVPSEINYNSPDHLYIDCPYRKATSYKNISEVENGYFIQINTKTLKSTGVKWFDIASYYKEGNDIFFDDSVGQL